MVRTFKFLIPAAFALCIAALPAQANRLSPPADIPSAGPSFQNVQSSGSDFRVIELEEQIRQLNGRVEELNFLLLQLQEKMRKLEEDNELRFQELEESRSGDADGEKSNDLAATDNADDGDSRLGKPEPSEDNTTSDGKDNRDETIASTTNQDSQPQSKPGTLPRALGTLTFDRSGNVVDTKPEGPLTLNAPKGLFDDATPGVEAAEFGATPKEVFAAAKKAMKERNYLRSEQAFAALATAWPKDPLVGEAKYYQGESQFWQKKYYQSANTHLEAHRQFPEAGTAADNLLGLGLALAGLNQREVACATYAEVLQQYPDAAKRLGERIKDEQAGARC